MLFGTLLTVFSNGLFNKFKFEMDVLIIFVSSSFDQVVNFTFSCTKFLEPILIFLPLYSSVISNDQKFCEL